MWDTMMVPLWLECRGMPTTPTLKNIHDEVHERLKLSALMHRRSMNSEAIVCLESALMASRLAPAERIAHARGARRAATAGSTKVHKRHNTCMTPWK
jgi:plasmid stability protein